MYVTTIGENRGHKFEKEPEGIYGRVYGEKSYNFILISFFSFFKVLIKFNTKQKKKKEVRFTKQDPLFLKIFYWPLATFSF